MAKFLLTLKALDGSEDTVTAIAETVVGDLPHPEHPIHFPPLPDHPIHLPPHPTHPIVIPPPPEANNDLPSRPIYIPGHPANPIVIPPWMRPIPGHPIVLPPATIWPGDGVPTNPIVLPPSIWDPAFPGNPIVIPPLPPLFPEGGCPPRVDNTLPTPPLPLRPSQGPGFPTNPIGPGGQPEPKK